MLIDKEFVVTYRMEEIVSELVAIWMWDEDYRLVSEHDEIDRIAWDARRKREAEIVHTLFASPPVLTILTLN